MLNLFILMKADTKLLNGMNSIITFVVIIGMIIIVGKAMWLRDRGTAISTIIIGGLLLWCVNSVDTFMGVFTSVMNFVASLFDNMKM